MAKQKLGPNQRKWLKALESGKFRQTTKVLKSFEGGYCCLGVACELFKTPRVKVSKGEESFEFNGSTGYAPTFIINALKLRDDVGAAKSRGNEDALTELNDHGNSFKDIAAIIKSDPAEYFKGPI